MLVPSFGRQGTNILLLEKEIVILMGKYRSVGVLLLAGVKKMFNLLPPFPSRVLCLKPEEGVFVPVSVGLS